MQQTSFTYEEGDLIAANLADYRRRLMEPTVRVRTAIAAIIVLAILGAAMSYKGETVGRIAIILAAAVIGGIGGLALMMVTGRWQLRRYARRNFAEQANLRDPFDFEWDADGFASRSPRGTLLSRWDELLRWHEAEAVFMLYLADRLFVALPRRAFDLGQIDSIRRACEAALPHGRRGSAA